MFAETNRLRTEGTDHLIAAARAAGARRLVWQSYAGWPYARQGGPVKTEDDPLDPEPPADARESLAAIRYLEAAVMGADGLEGVVLRYGGFYGPGTSIDEGGEHVELIRKRRVPGRRATARACGRSCTSTTPRPPRSRRSRAARPGIYNVVDDDPAPATDWLPALAAAIGAPPPRRLPAWLVRLAGGRQALSMMTRTRGASNAKAERELGWRPQHSWRELQYGGKSAYQSPSTRNDFQNARLASSSSSASSMLGV